MLKSGYGRIVNIASISGKDLGPAGCFESSLLGRCGSKMLGFRMG